MEKSNKYQKTHRYPDWKRRENGLATCTLKKARKHSASHWVHRTDELIWSISSLLALFLEARSKNIGSSANTTWDIGSPFTRTKKEEVIIYSQIQSHHFLQNTIRSITWITNKCPPSHTPCQGQPLSKADSFLWFEDLPIYVFYSQMLTSLQATRPTCTS